MRVWPVKVPDLAWKDWRFALEQCVAAGDPEPAARRLESRWAPSGDALACLSVRSTFDLLLRAAGWAPGDEIVFTAVTIPDMPRIARLHGLRPVGLDVDAATAAPDAEGLSRLVGPRTRAVVHAHLFGGRADVDPLLEEAHRRGLLFVEDCAQCYAGPGWTGHEASDVTLFSFGPWKTATALGGALARVRDPDLRERMRARSRRDPVEGTASYLARLLACGALKAAADPAVYGSLVEMARGLGADHRTAVHRLTKGYRGADFAARIRRRPGGALLTLLERRLDEGPEPVRRRREPARTLLDALGTEVVVPGRDQAEHGWWMVPVRVDGPRAPFMEALLRAGFDTTRARLTAVGRRGHGADAGADPATGDDAGEVPGARRLLDSSVYVPFDPAMDADDLRRLGRAVRATLGLRPPSGSTGADPAVG